MATLRAHGVQHLARLTTAARLARMRPAAAVEVGAGVVRTERLVIRPLTWGDRAGYIEAVRASRAELDRFCPQHREGETDDELFDRQLQMGRAAEATGRGWRRIAEEAACPGRVVGAFNLNDVAYGLEPRAELNLWTRTDDSGKRFAAEAVGAVLAHAFAPRWSQRVEGRTVGAGLALARVDALVSPGNAGCLKMIARFGFVRDEGKPEAARTLRVGGEDVVHEAYVRYAPVAGVVELKPRIAADERMGRAVEMLMGIEGRAAAGG